MFTCKVMSTNIWIVMLTTICLHLANTQEGTDRCFTKLTLDDMGTYEITSPNVSDSQRNTSCIRTWQIDVLKFRDNMTLHLEFDTDLVETVNCTSEYVKVISNSSLVDDSRELVVLCGQHEKEYEFFIDSILILFKTSPSQRANFNLVYRLKTVSSCSQTLYDSYGLVTSPGYPEPYPSYQRCTYRFEVISVGTVMQLNFLFLNMSDNCLHDYLLIYGGTSENGRFVGKYCGQRRWGPEFKEFYKSLFLVFVSSDNKVGRTGFRARYQEVQCGGNLDVSVHESKLRFPGYSYPFTRNIRCSWLLISGYELHKILLTFNDVQFDCSKTTITVNDEKRKNRTDMTFCGNTQQMYLSSGPKVTVSLTNTMENTVSFVMHFKSELIPACGQERLYLTSYEYAQALKSPEYPIRYPDYLNCVWVIRTASKANWIKVTVEDIDLESSCNDKLLLYEGDIYDFNKNPERSFDCGYYDGILTAPYTSEGNTITLLFYSNARNVGKGFKLYYQSLTSDSEMIMTPITSTNDTGVFIGVVVAVLVIVVIIVIVMIVVIRKRRSAPEPQSSNHVYTHSRDPSVPSLMRMRESITAPPPSYQEVSAYPSNENGIQDRDDPDRYDNPPVYSRDENGGQNNEQTDRSVTPSAPPADASLPPTYSEAMLNNMIQVEWF